ncbi:hypothetical protein [Enhygromyxa salina]|uniref:hypothetical protein n=1 Tax=Enhygromyxa salina TaxID=215803 RepID=UPI0013FCFE46|nr:hypothetical protein [Enhygromyxa salina]
MHDDPTDSIDPLDDIVRELLLERTANLDAKRLAAFIDGWGSLLRLLDRTNLLLPGAPEPLTEALQAVVGRIRESQARVLDDDDDV